MTLEECYKCPPETHRGALWAEPQPVQSRFGTDAGLENCYLGGQVFLVLGGPSLRELDLDILRQRGVATMAVNNVAAMVRPRLWTVGDPVNKFHDAVWRDPGILKFVPQPRLDNYLRSRAEDGTLRGIELTPRQCPGVLSVRRNTAFDPESWLWEPTVNWGNGKESAAENGYPRVLSTMLQALRLLFYLGFRTVYLLGCDFTMGSRYHYAFPERRSDGAVGGNNNAYIGLSKLLALLRPEFDRVGYTVINCNPESGLTVFDYLPFADAVRIACDSIDQQPDTMGWYE